MSLAPHRPYHPRGAALQLLTCRAREVLLSGPAGTGKSRGCLEKLHLCAEKYPGMRALMLRKTRESLTESALVTWETKVVPAGHPCLAGPSRESRQRYLYPNGSEIVVGGLRQSGRDLTQKVMSTEYDLIYAQEAIELAEADWEKATTRLRHGVMPYQQLLADTNPDAPHHWLKRRCDRAATLLLESRHEDNPLLWDVLRGAWTAAGATYIATLDALTGPRKERLRHGRWVTAEGVVYEEWDAALHLIDPFPVPPEWPRYWAVDFGFTNPFVWQEWAQDPDGRLYLLREIYRTQTLTEDHAREILRLWLLGVGDAAALAKGKVGADAMRARLRPKAIVCDHDAEDRATLERHLKLATTAAVKDVSPGLQSVRSRLRKAGDGRPRLFVFRGACVQRDRALVAASRPATTAEEFDAYVWDTRTGKLKEEPLKENDHGMDALRYLVYYLDGSPKKQLKVW